MPHAKLTLRIPDGVWIGDLSRLFSDTRFRILAAIPGDSTGVGLLEVRETDLAPVLQELRSIDEITEFELLQRSGELVLLQFETSNPLLLEPMQGSGVPIEMPFDIVDGEASWEVTAPSDRLSELGEQLDSFGINFTVEHIHQHLTATQLLTDRQRRIIDAAIEHGYYDTPRRCSLTELANKIGIAKSTCSETLHRAEEKIVKQFASEASP